MKIDRLVGILSILLQRDKVTAPYLAEKFEVSRRTINRDIEDLSKAGIPIVTTQGVGGGISIMEGYRIDRTLLTSADMQAILTGLRGLDSVSGTSRYRQLMDRICTQDSLSDPEKNMIVDLSGWDKCAVSDKLELILKAIEGRRKISFRYCSQSGESRREIEPYHLIFQWSNWYVQGYCLTREECRMFRLTRMTDLRDTGEACSDREVPEYICDKFCHTEDEISATVRFDGSERWRVADEFGADRLQYAEDGSLIMDITWSDVPSFYRFLLSFGDRAEILAPECYREGFLEIIKNMLKIYKT